MSERTLITQAKPEPHASAFNSAEGEAAFFSVYDAAMKLWPVPYDEMNISNRFGVTHLVACGPRAAPPLVLLHGYWATLTMWAPYVAEFSRGHRVYAIDVMGQPGKSILEEPIRNAADYVAWLAAVLDALPGQSLIGRHVLWGVAGLQLRGRSTGTRSGARSPVAGSEPSCPGQTVRAARDADDVASDSHG